jgi:glycosyltransferase involved in cell wall biosynthesis
VRTTRNKRILYICYTNPGGYPPLGHSAQILSERGWDIVFLGIHNRGESNKLHFATDIKVSVQLLRSCPPGWTQKLHFLGFCLWAIAWVVFWRPRWVYASDSLACPAALVASSVPGVRVLYHEHDTPAAFEDRRGNTFSRLVQWARRCVARRADVCILPNESRAESFVKVNPSAKVRVVWNCPLTSEVASAEFGRQDPCTNLYFHGNISSVLLPITIIESLKQVPAEVSLSIVGYETIGSAGYVTSLKERARELGVSHRFSYLGAMPREYLMKACSGADIGLVLIPLTTPDPNLGALVGASNKAFEYLACGLALLVPDLPDWRKTFVDAGYGLACDPSDPSSIASAVRWFCEHPEETREMGLRGRERILSEWNYERVFQPVLEMLQA